MIHRGFGSLFEYDKVFLFEYHKILFSVNSIFHTIIRELFMRFYFKTNVMTPINVT